MKATDESQELGEQVTLYAKYRSACFEGRAVNAYRLSHTSSASLVPM